MDWGAGAVRAALCGHHGAVHALAALPARWQLATASGDGTIKLWDVPTSHRADPGVVDTPRATLRGHEGGVHALVSLPGLGPNGGDLLVSGAMDGCVKLWRLADVPKKAEVANREGGTQGSCVVTLPPPAVGSRPPAMKRI